MKNIIIKEVPIDEAIKVHRKIIEFTKQDSLRYYFTNRIRNKDKLIIVAYIDKNPAGYIAGYRKNQDNSFYCWLAGVDPKYRHQGIFKKLMDYQIKWAKKHGYKKIKIKTHNQFRNMLAYLVKYDFKFTKVIPGDKIENYQIILEKEV